MCSSSPAGAFHVAKPSDMLPELQGRLPIRVELKALTEDDFVRDPVRHARQPGRSNIARCSATEEVTLDFTDDGIAAIARIAAQVNDSVENIGARRLQTVMEKLLEEVSFEAEDRGGRHGPCRRRLRARQARCACAGQRPQQIHPLIGSKRQGLVLRSARPRGRARATPRCRASGARIRRAAFPGGGCDRPPGARRRPRNPA